jgi:catechol 2,3-dioxygenase-like lactoylglutathione lyase family enzyme
MDAKLWNIGVKVADVSAELSYFSALGATLVVHEELATPDGSVEFALIEFGATRLFLTPKPIFLEKLPSVPPDGLTHVVFEVADIEHEAARLIEMGTEVLTPPIEIKVGQGRRRIAFFRSPGGLVFEIFQAVAG